MSVKVNLFFFILIFAGCQSKYHHLPEVPPPLPEVSMVSQPKVALVLGGGGAKGIAHVGVLEVLEEENIPIDLIVGCSAGSIVGALYADDPDAASLRDQLVRLKKRDLLDIRLWQSAYGISKGKALHCYLDEVLCAKKFEDLQIPLLIATADLKRGSLVTLGKGAIIPAVYASSAIPGYFEPVILHGRVLVDGGVVNPIPVSVAQEHQAQVVIAVDVSGYLKDSMPRNLFEIAKRSIEIMIFHQNAYSSKGADVIIKPDIRDMGVFDDSDLETIYRAGREAAQKAIPEIKKLLAGHK